MLVMHSVLFLNSYYFHKSLSHCAFVSVCVCVNLSTQISLGIQEIVYGVLCWRLESQAVVIS